jgi:methylenetetrahydrofolate reductase (NADPH)
VAKIEIEYTDERLAVLVAAGVGVVAEKLVAKPVSYYFFGEVPMALNAVTEKQAIIDLMQKTSVEVTPGGATKVPDFRELLRPGCLVYVTFLPGSDFADTVATVRRLKDEGFNPVPHFAARSIPSAKFLEENLASLQGETGVTEGLLIGGGVTKPVGDFASSIEVLQTGLFEKYGMLKMGLASHPEGSPDIKPI